MGFVRPRLADLLREPFDVIVIGGGINGAGIAREAALHGYRTLLVEREDFGAGTTSRATRLIHGGLRYLEHGELRLVYESLHDREDLLREKPHLVHPLRLLIPVYRGDPRPPWKIRAGLALYDLLSLRKSLPRHRAMPRAAVHACEPRLSGHELRAAYAFYDAQVEFPERLVIEAVRDLEDGGGVALNHVSAVRLASPGGVVCALALRDHTTGETVELPAHCVVNAAGPWVDEVLAGSDAERHNTLIGGTKGSHLVVDWADGPRHAVFASAKADGRPFFILPWYRYTLVGTTDLRFVGDPSDAVATRAEVDYLLDAATRLFPETPLRSKHILYTYSGVRPLPYAPGEHEAAITRRHFLLDHVSRGGPAGLLTVAGGKLTTYPSLARSALAPIARHATPSLAGAATEPAPRRRARPPDARSDGHLDDPLAQYGGRQDEVREVIARRPSFTEPICAHNPEVLGQVVYAVEREHAVTLADVLLRRLRCGWSECHALDGAQRAAAVIAEASGWDEARTSAEVDRYTAELRRTLVPLEDVATEGMPPELPTPLAIQSHT